MSTALKFMPNSLMWLQWPGRAPTSLSNSRSHTLISVYFKGILTFFLEIGSFYHSPRVKQLGFTVIECIQMIFWYLEEYQ